ncbi:hypothetical protein [Streptomyces sp. NPDC020298]|uniref:hypothetical protein n=1 Tax=unclassified Streptomyces TaxID=2593676 RepID=UPI00340D05A1
MNHTDPTAETRVSYFIQSRPTADAPWQPHGLRASWASKDKGLERLASRREMQPTWEHRLMTRTTTVIEEPTAVVSPPTDRAELRDRIAEALYAHNHPGWAIGYTDLDQDERDTYLRRADAVLAVLPEQTDRAAYAQGLLHAADFVRRLPLTRTLVTTTSLEAELRRLAVEADGSRVADEEQPATEARPQRGDQFEQWLKKQRDAAADYPEAYQAADGLLDMYRLHADTGTPLSDHVCEGQAVGDCECLEPPTVARPGQPDTDEEATAADVQQMLTRMRANAATHDLDELLRRVAVWAASSEGRDVLLDDLVAGGYRLPHACGNCEGIDPDSCLKNPDRPAPVVQQPAATDDGQEAPPCAECPHPHAVHRDGDDPVTPGLCLQCEAEGNVDDARHDYTPAVPPA